MDTWEPIQENYGWGLWATTPGTRFWIALSYVGTKPQEEPPEWMVSVSGPGPFAEPFHSSGAEASFTQIRDCIWEALADQDAIEALGNT